MLNAAAHKLGTFRLAGRRVPGQGRAADAVARIAHYFGGQQAVLCPWPGVRFQTDLRDRIQRQMWAGIYELHVRAALNALLKSGDVYVDVGSHIGYHSVAAANRVGSEGRVFAFEADPKLYEGVVANLAQFGWARATHAAVWQHTGRIDFSRSPVASESGWGSVTEVREFSAGEHVEVSAIALDDWLATNAVNRWDAMKLDAEGSELAVLRGAERSLQKHQPFVWMEINGALAAHRGGSADDLVTFMADTGYLIFRLDGDFVRPWESKSDAEFQDTLCIPHAKANWALARLREAGFKVSV